MDDTNLLLSKSKHAPQTPVDHFRICRNFPIKLVPQKSEKCSKPVESPTEMLAM